MMKLYFPHVYDIKYLVREYDHLRGGLAVVASSLGVPRIGPMHQAGSDALITASTFFALREKYFDGKKFDARQSGILYGLRNAGSSSGSGALYTK